ncbi:tandem-type lipoprotein [Macrococcus armenti]|uniref:tandem-type lipoprotein n=1 Tax=Macrococcus armenti TaxID=2875764 RepID=UPI001CCE8990|nr:tandem-type lipoprotein [Macrococcus armenti]UBH14796.1 tandem-type lipoprotein [Macrococcus armenti]UBH17155.1 tandem-type lipoprotein [Macrococcus armenti]UBH19421.1 tandem-type lipoprotein [Macrococcus armenti]
MNKYKRLLLLTGVSLMMLNTGCSNITLTKNQKVEQAFEKHLSIYPVKNLEDFYDMEGFRDEEFEKNDKGTWVVSSYFSEKASKKEPLISRGLVLFINRNNKKVKGNYIVDKITPDLKGNQSVEYPVEMKNNKIIPIGNMPREIKEQIENYRFLVQDESIGDLSKLKRIKERYNEEMPLYTQTYELAKNNNINKWVQNKYSIDEKKAELYIEKSGELKGSSIGYLNFEISYNPRYKNHKYYSESVQYQPSKELD